MEGSSSGQARGGAGLPLLGVTVVSVEQAVAAPLATRQLADLGARVIKVERPDGGDFARSYDTVVEGLSSHFVWLNRSKESIALDLKAPLGREVLERLLAEADVFVQNLAPGAAARLGLGSEALLERFPTLVACDISGYGDGGPWEGRKAYDLLVQAEVGVVSVTGSGGCPAKVGIAVADIAAGMYAFAAVLAALFDRERSGRGRSVRVSLFDSLADWMGYPFYYGRYAGEPPRLGVHHATIAPYGPVRTEDGAVVLVAVQNEREWAAFCREVLGCDELAHDARFADNSARVANREALHAEIDRCLVGVSGDELRARLERARIATGAVNRAADLLDHPQLVSRGRWASLRTPRGTVPSLLPPIRLDAEPQLGPVPEVGEHTEQILAELGYTEARIDELEAAGASPLRGAAGP